MADLHHGSNDPNDQGNQETAERNTRYGLILFVVYLCLYGGFVFLNAFAPGQMESMTISGVNLAIIYGFVLIIAAFILALIYGWLCRRDVSSPQDEEKNS